MDDIAAYNLALYHAKMKALETLNRLLRDCQDPAEARRLSALIVRAKPHLWATDAGLPPLTPSARDHADSANAQPQTHASAARSTPTPFIQRPAAHASDTPPKTRSLPFYSGTTDVDHPIDPLRLPLSHSDANEPPQGGGPAPTRPFPLPLGLPRA